MDDQRGSPTYTVDLADAIAGLQPSAFSLQQKVLNITNSGSCSWYRFAKEILKTKGIEGVTIEEAKSEEMGLPARRPKMSILDNSKFEALYGGVLPTWQDALMRYLKCDR